MGGEFVLVLGFPNAADGAVDLALQMVQGAILAHPRPEGMNLLAAELAYGMKLDFEGRGMDARQGLVQHDRGLIIHLANEAQGEMELIAGLPAGARHAALNQQQGLRNLFWQRQRHKQPHWANLPSGRARRKVQTTTL